MKKVALLLTGTVNPGQMALTQLQDPAVRRAQYVTTINYWLGETDLPLVFVENSGSDLSTSIDKRHAGRVEFLTFNGNDYPKHFGKGLGELKCLEHASIHSRYLHESDFIFKITGRYQIPNFAKFYKYYLKNDGMYVFGDLKRGLKFAEARLFGFQPSFLSNHLFKYENFLNDSEGRLFEHVLAKAILEAIINERKFEQFPYYPEIVGFSGTDNKPYTTNPLYFFAKQIHLYVKAKLMKI